MICLQINHVHTNPEPAFALEHVRAPTLLRGDGRLIFIALSVLFFCLLFSEQNERALPQFWKHTFRSLGHEAFWLDFHWTGTFLRRFSSELRRHLWIRRSFELLVWKHVRSKAMFLQGLKCWFSFSIAVFLFSPVSGNVSQISCTSKWSKIARFCFRSQISEARM